MSSEGAASSQSSSYKIKLPAKYFEFVHDQMGGKGFKVKCLLCHENKTKLDKSGKPEYLSITNNSVFNARRLITVFLY
jgi:hypothetical protein